MRFFDAVCETVVRALGLSSFTPWGRPHAGQQPLGKVIENDEGLLPGPKFRVPNSNIECDYSAMKGYTFVGGSQKAVGSWLEPPNKSLPTYNIFTDYENATSLGTPQGITRNYNLELINGTLTGTEINADGVKMIDSKLFNGTYPGPWIQACWGDTIVVNVTNHLKTNGTSVHWHGIRQLTTWNMDGVNAITQCAVAPNDFMVYTFKAQQYGTSWYHSHYSLQYPDGVLGPLTIFGPSSAQYDDALDPWLVTDWAHKSAFTGFTNELHAPPGPSLDTILLNGTGTYNCTSWTVNYPNEPCPKTPGIFKAVFKQGKRYLVRLINTSTATTFIFTVDKHIMKVIGADFVPINPYYTDAVFVGIGQRYHVVIEANPANELTPIEDQNYWIRAIPADGCEGGLIYGNETVGVIRYSQKNTKTPTTTGYTFPHLCQDEPYASLVPVVQKTVGKAKNDFSGADDHQVGVWRGNTNTIPNNNLTRWTVTNHTMWLNFSDPSINHVTDAKFPAEKALVFENYGPDDWVYLIIEGIPTPGGIAQFVPLFHPIHLHGHDFFLLAQHNGSFKEADINNPSIFHFDNPPRRDVTLLPLGGYIAIAFKTDNPGIWALHCHIAWHASGGLALQVFERQPDVIKQAGLPGWREQTDRVCANWTRWLDNPKNWFNSVEFQEDSGI